MDSSIFSFAFFLAFVIWIIRSAAEFGKKSKQNAEKPLQRPANQPQRMRNRTTIPSVQRPYQRTNTTEAHERTRLTTMVSSFDQRSIIEREGYTVGSGSSNHDQLSIIEREGYTVGGTGSTEGEDPCHGDYAVYVPYSPAEQTEQRTQLLPSANTLDRILNLQGHGLVQGIIFTEVLARKPLKRGHL